MADYRKMNWKTLVKRAGEAGIPVPEMPEDADDEQKKKVRSLLAHALEKHDAPPEDEKVEEKKDDAPPPPSEPAALVTRIKLAGEVPESVFCKNCGRDLVAIRDFQVMVPPGFLGAPNSQMVMDQAYCSGCSVAANSRLPVRDRWRVIAVELPADEED